MRRARSLALLAVFFGLPAMAWGQTQLSAKLDGNQEVPNVTTEGAGTGCFTLSDQGLHFFLTVDNLSSPITAAHFHLGKRGENGGVLRTITANFNGTSTAMGLWTPTDAEPLDNTAIAALMMGRVYVNVHTQSNPSGEVRGQLDISGGAHFTANLTGEQENPGVNTEGVGTASVTLTSQGLEYKLTVRDLSSPIMGAHIHQGAIGVNGGVQLDILPTFVNSTAEGIWRKDTFGGTLTPELVEELMKGDLYFNIHTMNNPSGEIRGQINLSAGFGASASMGGSQTVPPSGEPGTGTGSFTLTPEGMKYRITVCDLTGPVVSAGIYLGEPGDTGPRVFSMPWGSDERTVLGLWKLDEGNEAFSEDLACEWFAGNLYVNVETEAHPEGEIRGQIMPNTGETTLTAGLTCEQVVLLSPHPHGITGEGPPGPIALASSPDQDRAQVNAQGTGTATLRLNPAGLSLQCTHDLGAITAAHIHRGRIGSNGPVVFNFTNAFDGCTAQATWNLSAADVKDLLTQSLYVQIHTAANPNGEIRGQIMLESGAGFAAPFTGTQEVPPVATLASGTCSGTLTPTDGFVFSCTHDIQNATAAHIHSGGSGTNGSVENDLSAVLVDGHERTTWSPFDPTPLTSALIDDLLLGGLYFNVHTPAAPGGEIRGQVLLSEGFYFGGSLSGNQEVPPVNTPATGTGVMTITEFGAAIRATHTVENPTAAHVHMAPAGSNGGVIKDLTADMVDGTIASTWRLDAATDPLVPDLVCENLLCGTYLNVHSAQHPGGEIRGQLCQRSAADVGEPVAGASPRLLLQNYPNPAVTRTTLSFELPSEGHASLRIYDLEGREIMTLVDGTLPAGRHDVFIDSGALSGGVYFYRLEAVGVAESRKLTIQP